VLNLLGAILWSTAFASLGYAFGNLVESLLGEVQRAEKWIFSAILLVGIAVALSHRWRRHPVGRSPGEQVSR
jgi:membrane protein DedA with SNARE-associated domain